MTEWKRVPGLPQYAVNREGKIHNVVRRKPLHPWPNKSGHMTVVLHHFGYKQDFLIHRLVAELFLPGYYPGMHLEWIDGDKSNNHVDNLRLKSSNARVRASLLAVRSNGRPVRIPELNGMTFVNAYEAAAYINGDVSNIYHVLAGRLKTHRGFHFEYADNMPLGGGRDECNPRSTPN